MNFESLTNARPVRQRGKVLTAMPPAPSASRNATGSFKMTEEVSDVLKVTEGDFVDIVKDKSSGNHYLTVGSAPNKEEGIAQNGSKLGKSGSVYKFAAAKAWVALGQNKAQVEYQVGEGIEQGGKTYFPLTKGDVIPVEEKETHSNEEIDNSITELGPESVDADFEEVANTPTPNALEEL